MFEPSEMSQMFAYVSAFNEFRRIYEKKREEFERYVSKDPKRSSEELAAEASKVLLDEILRKYKPEEIIPELEPVLKLARSKPASEVGELFGDFIKFYFRQQGIDSEGKEKSGEEVIKEAACKCVKKFILKQMLGD